MNWCILLLLVSCAAALPQDRPQHARRTAVHRRAPAVPVPPHGAVRVYPPAHATSAKRSSAKHGSVKQTAVAVPIPARSPIPPPVRVAGVVKRVTPTKRVPNFKPDVKTLTREESEALQRQIQQWQIAVLGGAAQSPGPVGPPGPPGTPPAYPAGPGTIWIQVPAPGYPQYPSYPGYPPYPGPPSIPPPPPPTAPQPPIPDEAIQGSVQPVPEVPPTEEGVPPQEEIPATGEAPTGETPEEGAVPEEEVPTDEVTPEEEPTAPEGEVPAEEVPTGEEGVPPEEVPEGGAPTGETPSEGGTGGGEAPAPGDEEDKLVHCKEKRGQFSHESSCSKFYNCWDDVVVEQSCPKGLAFSEEHSYCDFPENVDCGGKPLDTPAPIPGEEGGCPGSYGSYRSKTNCSEFFICVNGDPVKFACPETLSYNEELGVCDYPYRVDCVNPPAPETPPEEGGGEESSPDTPAEEQPPAEDTGDSVRGLPPSFLKSGSPCWHNNVYPLNNACSRVSICRSGFTAVLACPNGMAYDKYKLRCLPYYRVRC